MDHDDQVSQAEPAGVNPPLVDYLTVLRWLHGHLKPQTYLEIGTADGTSLRLANCDSIAVDPHFVISENIMEGKPSCSLFQMPSDRFFRTCNPQRLVANGVDFAFIDGMHFFEYALRDFINVESLCRRNSVIAIHDTVPGNLRMAERMPRLGEAWTGDVWKMVLALCKFRPDLHMLAIDADPSGILLVTNLNPTSIVLEQRYFAIVEEFSPLSLEEYGLERYRNEIRVRSPELIDQAEKLAAYFWQ